jgi:Luciferase-like monooxygenase
MPPAGTPLEKLGFLTIGLFDETDPGAGHETTLRMIELGERLGFDSAWVRHRHLQYGISSPIAVLAAATQRTRRIELGTAVIPLGWENPLRLAEDLATVDVLSGVPTDGATPEQVAKYEAYVAGRTPRTATPQGPGRLMFARDLVGPSARIAEALYAHAGFQEVTEVAFALPFTFDEPDYVQILTDIATRLGPALDWKPGG